MCKFVTLTCVTFKKQTKTVNTKMSSLTGEFTNFTKSESENKSVNERRALSTIKRPRQFQRRKFNIMPLCLDEIQKEIDEAVAHQEHTWEAAKEPLKKIDPDKENENKPQPQLQDSFDLNFAALSLNTPAKQPEEVKLNKFTTPCQHNSVNQFKTNRSLNFQYVTPNNKIPPKVQCSVNMQTYIKTPITVLTAQKPKNNDQLQTVPQELAFPKIIVNNVMYVVLNELGKGGSSNVFQCFNVNTKALRAIKVVSLDNNSAIGFINEVKMLKTLQKCNRIIKMYDFEIKEEEKLLLVVLEVGGTDLSKILKESAANTTHMPLYMLLYYWMEMLYAVKQIHSHGIIHADLKPANFLKVEGYLKLIDFGIAMSVQADVTSVVKTVPEGSFNYISPEALNNTNSSANVDSPSYGKPKYKLSCKSDVWSLGCILYQLVYRRTPFQHITQMYVKLAKIMDPNHQIEYPDANWVPEKLVNTIKACLQVNMKSRPSVDELIEEYENMFHSMV